MKKLFLGLAGVFLILAISGSAEAYTIYTDSGNDADSIYLRSNPPTGYDDTYTWSFSVTDLGIDSFSDVDVELYLTLTDDEYDDTTGDDFDYGEEKAAITVSLFDSSSADSDDYYTTLVTSFLTGEFSFDITDLFADIDTSDLSNYTLQIIVQAEAGDFYINKVEVTPNPEPATFVLFGLGLLSFAGIMRRKRS